MMLACVGRDLPTDKISVVLFSLLDIKGIAHRALLCRSNTLPVLNWPAPSMMVSVRPSSWSCVAGRLANQAKVALIIAQRSKGEQELRVGPPHRPSFLPCNAPGGSRTRTPVKGTCPSSTPVCQFQHRRIRHRLLYCRQKPCQALRVGGRPAPGALVATKGRGRPGPRDPGPY